MAPVQRWPEWARSWCKALLFGMLALGLWVESTQAQLEALQGPAFLRLGVLDSPLEEVLGRITDVAVDQSGNVFVLDGAGRDVRWFDPEGEFVASAGGEGDGPGELRSPVALAVDSSGRVQVLDPQSGRITTYEPLRGALLHKSTLRVPPVTSFCLIGSRRFLLGYASLSSAGLIREVDGDGHELRSFAEPLDADAATVARLPQYAVQVRDNMNRGYLVCDPPTGTIVMVHEEVPLVRAFTTSGSELWRTELSDFHRVHYREGSRPGSLARDVDPHTRTYHVAIGATVGDGIIVVTLHEGGPAVPDGRLEASVLSLRDGREIGRQPVSVRIAAVWRRQVYGVVDFPYPQVLAFRQSGG